MIKLKAIIITLLLVVTIITPVWAGELHKAIESGDFEKAISIIDNNPSLISEKDDLGNTPLHMACMGGNRDLIEYLIANKADINARDTDEVTPLHYLAFGGHVESIELLMANGAEIEARDALGFTPLHYAAYAGKIEAVEMLLASGADINSTNNKGSFPLDYAIDMGRDEVVLDLESKGGKSTPIGDAVVAQPADNTCKIAFSYGDYPNTLLYTSSGGLLLVDTGWKRTVKAMQSEIAKIADGKIKYIINTHLHPDHSGGNSIADDNTIIINYSNLDSMLAEGVITKGNIPLKPRSGSSFETYYTMSFDDLKILLIPSPGTHTAADMIIYFPDLVLVHMGDLLIGQSFPSVTNNVPEYLEILQTAINTFPEETKFVCGHGENLSMEGLEKYYKVLTGSMEIVKKEMTAGKSLEDVLSANVLKDYVEYDPFIPELNTEYWIKAIYLSNSDESEETRY